ncbi:hypothetical protein FGO68_gene1484 [Halteria grandinella]|uniref:Uncharacterized protein n=1 Tax=Halteria grandinella TaxID=5974 RepID=A0A8J8NCF3_HALGN|nr:hypothetical protein FGO68_gene1484 [Halteria grandinella]
MRGSMGEAMFKKGSGGGGKNTAGQVGRNRQRRRQQTFGEEIPIGSFMQSDMLQESDSNNSPERARQNYILNQDYQDSQAKDSEEQMMDDGSMQKVRIIKKRAKSKAHNYASPYAEYLLHRFDNNLGSSGTKNNLRRQESMVDEKRLQELKSSYMVAELDLNQSKSQERPAKTNGQVLMRGATQVGQNGRAQSPITGAMMMIHGQQRSDMPSGAVTISNINLQNESSFGPIMPRQVLQNTANWLVNPQVLKSQDNQTQNL